MSAKRIIFVSLFIVIIGIAAGILVKYAFITTKDSVVDPKSYLGKNANPPDLYGQPGNRKLYSPINAGVAQMDKLLLVNFKDDPEYEAIELQTFDDRRGKAARVLMYHHAGPADYYYSDPAFIDPAETSRNFVVPQMQYRFEVTASGLDAALQMQDKNGKSIECVLKEIKHTTWAKGFLAPVGGSEAISFDHFPFYHMKNMNFMPWKGAAPQVKIGGEPRPPEMLPVPVNLELVYLTRYTDSPIIGQWNRPYNGDLPAMQPVEQLIYQDGKISYELLDNTGHFEIRKMTCRGDRHKISFEFSPAIPDLPAMKDGAEVNGKFSAGADEIEGIVAGTYRVMRHGQTIEMEILPLEGWQPFPGVLWVKTWEWKGTITIKSDDSVSLKSGWIRIKPRQ
jgi:hypothetical protein